MTFPAKNGPTEQLADALFEARALARTVKASSISLRDHSVAGDVSARGIVIYTDDLTATNDRFDELKTVPGAAQYAKDQYNDQGFDFAAEFLTMQAALVDVVAWVDANVPKDPGARWLHVEEIVGGRLVERMLTPAQTAGLRTEVDVLIATID